MCIHKWSKWGLPYEYVKNNLGHYGAELMVITVQDRQCTRCDLREIREVFNGGWPKSGEVRQNKGVSDYVEHRLK